MGIQKTKVLSSGVSGNYWRIRGIYISPDGGGVRAFADLFTDMATSTSGAPLASQDVLLFNEDNPLSYDVLADAVEAKLITMAGDFLSGTIVEP